MFKSSASSLSSDVSVGTDIEEKWELFHPNFHAETVDNTRICIPSHQHFIHTHG